MDNKKQITVTVIVILLIAAGLGFWFWSKNKPTPPASQTKENLAPTLGGTIFEKTQNPLKGKLPETNPFKEQKNPFDAIYQNPFK